MAVRDRPRKPGLRVAAWLSLAIGMYAVLAVASVLGLLTGGGAGLLGGMIAIAVLTDRPEARTRRRAKIALGLNGLASAVCAAVLIAIWISEL